MSSGPPLERESGNLRRMDKRFALTFSTIIPTSQSNIQNSSTKWYHYRSEFHFETRVCFYTVADLEWVSSKGWIMR